ncbi:MFS transporter [Rhodococcus sp. OK519]|uniref:MFS transporter n=1 Tax=Rhodococcus sp. OK519 TaxID=2135729 RepID=UPI000D431A83|nr:MFS transporter [Rhodococcus sp. OK519]
MTGTLDGGAPVGTPPVAVDTDAGTHRWTPRLVTILVVLILVSEIIPVSAVLAGTALPAIAAEYATTQAGWTMTISFLTASIAMPLVGKLADMYGKKRLLMIVLTVTLVGSVLSSIASSFSMFLVGRALQGAIFSVAFLCYSLIRDVFPARIVPFAVSVTVTGTGVVVVLQPFLAGWLIDNHGVAGAFWFVTALTAALGVAALLVVPESPVRAADSRPDLLGAFLLGSAAASVLVAVSSAPQWGWTSEATVGLLVLGCVLFATWIVQAGRTPEPLIDLRQLRRPALLYTVLSSGLVYGVGTTTSSILAIMAMTPREAGVDYGFGMTASEFAVFGVVNGIGIVLGGLIVGVTARRTGAKVHMIAAAVVIAAAVLTMGFGRGEELVVLIAAGLVNLGTGLAGAAIPNLVIAAVPPDNQVVSSSLAEVSRTLLAGVGTTLVFVMLNANVRTAVDGVPVYSGGGFMWAYSLVAACAVVGGVAAAFLPRRLGAAEQALRR